MNGKKATETGLFGNGMRFGFGNGTNEWINIRLSQVYDFRPPIFGKFVAFPEIRQFAGENKRIFCFTIEKTGKPNLELEGPNLPTLEWTDFHRAAGLYRNVFSNCPPNVWSKDGNNKNFE